MKRKTAYNMAIDALNMQKKRFVVGYKSYEMRKAFDFVRRDHQKYSKINEAIKILEKERDHEQYSMNI